MTRRWRKLGIIAGGGALPLRVTAACEARGEPFHVIRLQGFADPALNPFPGETCALGEIGKILKSLRTAECDAAVFAGVVRRPDFANIKVDWRGAALMPKVAAAAARGDGALLQVLVDTVEAEGMFVVGAEEAMRSLAATQGPLGAHRPDEDDLRDMRKAAAVIRALGPYDVGQAAVVARGLVLAIEAAEGTDAMLARCAALPESVRGGARAGVLVKRPKPGQELRIDLPVIGPETIRRARAAGLCGVAVEAGLALIIDRDDVVKLADEAGLFVYGFTAAEARAS